MKALFSYFQTIVSSLLWSHRRRITMTMLTLRSNLNGLTWRDNSNENISSWIRKQSTKTCTVVPSTRSGNPGGYSGLRSSWVWHPILLALFWHSPMGKLFAMGVYFPCSPGLPLIEEHRARWLVLTQSSFLHCTRTAATVCHSSVRVVVRSWKGSVVPLANDTAIETP